MLAVTSEEINPFSLSDKAHTWTHSVNEMGIDEAQQEKLAHGLFKREVVPAAGRPLHIKSGYGHQLE